MPVGAPPCHEPVRRAIPGDRFRRISCCSVELACQRGRVATGGAEHGEVTAASGVHGDGMRAAGQVIGIADRPGMTSCPVMMKTRTPGRGAR
jgi:hypothetical protein